MREEIFWKNSRFKKNPSLLGDISCKYLIVGGGITGVSLAYFLSRHRKNIVLIEKNFIGSGATGKAAGILTPSVELDLKDLVKIFGKELGLLFWLKTIKGVKSFEKIIKTEKIECDFEEAKTIYAEYKKYNYRNVFSEYLANKKFRKNVKFLLEEELCKKINTNIFKDALLSCNAVSINPLKFVQGLSKALTKKGVKVYENTALLSYKNNNAFTKHAKISYEKIFVCTDSFSKTSGLIPLQSTILVTQELSKKQLILSRLRNIILWDSRKDYHYLKLTKDKRLLIGYGGQKRVPFAKRNSLNKKHFANISKFLKKLFPYLSLRIDFAWSGMIGTTKNFIPILEFKKDSVKIVATSGLPVSVMLAEYIANRVSGKKSELDKIFS